MFTDGGAKSDAGRACSTAALAGVETRATRTCRGAAVWPARSARMGSSSPQDAATSRSETRATRTAVAPSFGWLAPRGWEVRRRRMRRPAGRRPALPGPPWRRRLAGSLREDGKFVAAGCGDQQVGDPRYPDLPWRRRLAGSLREDG